MQSPTPAEEIGCESRGRTRSKTNPKQRGAARSASEPVRPVRRQAAPLAVAGLADEEADPSRKQPPHALYAEVLSSDLECCIVQLELSTPHAGHALYAVPDAVVDANGSFQALKVRQARLNERER